MSCVSDTPDEIAWTHDGNAVINAPCTNLTSVFLAKNDADTSSCNIVSLLDEAQRDPFVKSISGPYGCTDASSFGISATSVVVVLGMYAV